MALYKRPALYGDTDQTKSLVNSKRQHTSPSQAFVDTRLTGICRASVGVHHVLDVGITIIIKNKVRVNLLLSLLIDRSVNTR